jgi:hypothetical protein
MVVKCICKHEAQDKIHGEQNRVANETKDPTRVRCTVCKTLITVNKKEK